MHRQAGNKTHSADISLPALFDEFKHVLSARSEAVRAGILVVDGDGAPCCLLQDLREEQDKHAMRNLINLYKNEVKQKHTPFCF